MHSIKSTLLFATLTAAPLLTYATPQSQPPDIQHVARAQHSLNTPSYNDDQGSLYIINETGQPITTNSCTPSEGGTCDMLTAGGTKIPPTGLLKAFNAYNDGTAAGTYSLTVGETPITLAYNFQKIRSSYKTFIKMVKGAGPYKFRYSDTNAVNFDSSCFKHQNLVSSKSPSNDGRSQWYCTVLLEPSISPKPPHLGNAAGTISGQVLNHQ